MTTQEKISGCEPCQNGRPTLECMETSPQPPVLGQCAGACSNGALDTDVVHDKCKQTNRPDHLENGQHCVENEIFLSHELRNDAYSSNSDQVNGLLNGSSLIGDHDLLEDNCVSHNDNACLENLGSRNVSLGADISSASFFSIPDERLASPGSESMVTASDGSSRSCSSLSRPSSGSSAASLVCALSPNRELALEEAKELVLVDANELVLVDAKELALQEVRRLALQEAVELAMEKTNKLPDVTSLPSEHSQERFNIQMVENHSPESIDCNESESQDDAHNSSASTIVAATTGKQEILQFCKVSSEIPCSNLTDSAFDGKEHPDNCCCSNRFVLYFK